MTTQVATSKGIKEFLAKPLVQEKIKELVGKNAATFGTSVMQIVNSNNMLVRADPMSVFNAACMAATLNLPISNTLGFAYIVPFNNSKENKVEAQFQMGYKGYIQLALRSGQCQRIGAFEVYKDQLICNNPVDGFQFDWDYTPEENEQPIGYYAFIRLLNGFTAETYMTEAKLRKHANTYSQTYKTTIGKGKAYGVWHENFNAMALKTVLTQLLKKYAPLSIEMQKAFASDQSVIRGDNGDEFDYIDNPSDVIEHQDSNAALEASMTLDEAIADTTNAYADAKAGD